MCYIYECKAINEKRKAMNLKDKNKYKGIWENLKEGKKGVADVIILCSQK